EGRCIAQPGEPANSRLKDQVKLKSYPVQELGGLVFAYLGPEPAPLLPRWDYLVDDHLIRQAGFVVAPYNWLQGIENSYDATHALSWSSRLPLSRLGQRAGAGRGAVVRNTDP